MIIGDRQLVKGITRLLAITGEQAQQVRVRGSLETCEWWGAEGNPRLTPRLSSAQWYGRHSYTRTAVTESLPAASSC